MIKASDMMKLYPSYFENYSNYYKTFIDFLI